MRQHPHSTSGRIIKAAGAASVGLALSMATSPFAAADDPVGSPTPSATASAAASPSPTVSPDPSVTPTGAESPSPSVVTTSGAARPTPVPSVTPNTAKRHSPNPGVEEAEAAAAPTSVSGLLRDATTGAPIPHSCVAWRPASVTSTATNGTVRVGDKGRWTIDTGDPGPFYISFYVTDNGDCSHPVLTGPDNYRAAWYRAHPFAGTNPSTALPPPEANPVAAGSTIVACLGTHNALPIECTTPNRTASGRVLGVGPEPILHACIVAIGPHDTQLGFAITDADGRWKVSGLPINSDYVVGAIPPFQTADGPCRGEDGPSSPPPGGLQSEFYDDTWIDFSDPRLDHDAFRWATDPDSPHPAVRLRNNRTGIDFCLTTETGRAAERGTCDPPTSTTTSSASRSSQPTLAATGGPSTLAETLGAILLVAGLSLLVRSSPIGRRAAGEDLHRSSGRPPQP